MNQEQRTKIGRVWVSLAQLHGKELNPGVLKMILDSVSDLDPDQVLNALNQWAKTSKMLRHPLPAEIRQMVCPELDENSIAIEIAHKIDYLVIKLGYAWEMGIFNGDGMIYLNTKNQAFLNFKDAVISEIGEIGWAVVCKRGGWRAVAQSSNEMEEGTFKAQMREQVKAVMTMQKHGADLARLEMPSKFDESKSIGMFGNIKQIEEVKK